MNGVIQNQERRVVTRTLHISSVDHAADILHTYFTESASTVPGALGCANLAEVRVAVYAATLKIAAYLTERLDTKVARDLGVNIRVTDKPEPTWTSQDGTCRPIREMPTTHLLNILRKYDNGGLSKAGIFNAIRRELQNRKAA